MPALPEPAEEEIEIAETREYSIWPGDARYLLIREEGSDEWHDVKVRGPNRADPQTAPKALTTKQKNDAIAAHKARRAAEMIEEMI
jgi:hypothetical protein